MAKRRAKTRRRARSNPRGILQVLPAGYGFVKTAEGEFFVSRNKMGGAFDGDLVEVAPAHVNRDHPQPGKQHNQTGRKPTARVVSVVQRGHETLIGRYEVADPFGVVVPADSRIPYDIFTMRADNPTIADGSMVRVRMVEYPSRNTAATGVIEEVLGSADDPRACIEAVIARHNLSTRFSDDAQAEAAAVQVGWQQALDEGYRDLRGRFVFTIDPVDARDYDDAVSVETLDGGRLRLGVHIADVSRYVPWGCSVDLAARQRATSIYLVDRVIPMLPENLCNHVCSLVPGHPRCTLSVDVVLDAQAQVQSVDFYPAVICSAARLSYEQAQCYIDAFKAGQGLPQAIQRISHLPMPQGALPPGPDYHEELFAAIGALHGMANKRRSLRQQAGGIDFETVEAKVVLDAQGSAQDVRLRTRTDATSCIEEAMILANECVARHLRDAAMPTIYRVHDKPAADSLAGLVGVLQEWGVDSATLDAVAAGSPHAIQQVLAQAQGRPEAELVSSLVLRSMQRAVYSNHNTGHYGLASQAYCHFTSPIRRYPDLVVHRMLRAVLSGRDGTYAQQVDSLAQIAQHSSDCERIADDAARETQEIKLVEYMGRHVGECFDGVVSGVATYGLFVRLPNTVEGVVPIEALGSEYFSFDPALHRLTGQDSATSFRLGQALRVRVVGAPQHARKLDLRLDTSP